MRGCRRRAGPASTDVGGCCFRERGGGEAGGAGRGARRRIGRACGEAGSAGRGARRHRLVVSQDVAVAAQSPTDRVHGGGRPRRAI
jgi:hypothetical protein